MVPGEKTEPRLPTASGGERQPGDRRLGLPCPPEQLEMQIRHTIITHKFSLLFQPHKPPVMKLKRIYFLINVTVISGEFRCLEQGLHGGGRNWKKKKECDFVLQKKF